MEANNLVNGSIDAQRREVVKEVLVSLFKLIAASNVSFVARACASLLEKGMRA